MKGKNRSGHKYSKTGETRDGRNHGVKIRSIFSPCYEGTRKPERLPENPCRWSTEMRVHFARLGIAC